MKTQNLQVLIILFSLIIIVFLYQLPTSVIKTKKNQDEIQGAVSSIYPIHMHYCP